MEVMDNGTLCSSLCQHPACWDTIRRRRHGLLPRAAPYASGADSDDSDDELPTQKVVNLLANYGEDPVDVYSPAVTVKARQFRSMGKSLRTIPSSYTMDSVPRLWAPHATPASLMQSSTGQVSSVVSSSEKHERQSKMGKVEVQEVFDLTDLHNNWREICTQKQYYVWMPNTRRKAKKPLSALKRVHDLKDVTEEMMPREIEWQRESTIMRHPARNYTPFLYRWSTGSSLPYTPESQYINNMGIYELLDLPRDVLTQVLNYVNPSDLRDAHRVADAVAKAMTKVDKSTTLDLANSDVLHQSKMELLDVSQRSARGPHMDTFRSQMIWQHTAMTSPGLHPRKKRSAPTTPQNTTVMAGHPNQGETQPSVAKHKPLPSIRGKHATGGRRQKTRLPTISLGLPTLPSDATVTRPFNYKLNTQVDLTLGHIPTPPMERSYGQGMSPDWVSLTQRPTLPSQMSGQDDLRSPDINGVDMEVDDDGRSPVETASGMMTDTTQMVAAAPTRAPVNTPDSPYMRTLERQVSGILGTIQEHDTTDGDWSRGGPLTPQPPSRRSVRFLGETPPTAAGNARGDESMAGGDQSTLRHGTPSVVEMDAGDKTDIGSKLGERVESAACVATPEQWPMVDEDTYRLRPGPTPTHTPGTMSVAEEEAATSTAGNVDARSDRSGLTSMLVKMSRENSLHSNKAKHIMQDPPTASPAPPPPSPEPKSTVVARMDQTVGMYESDSEPGFDLTVKPPSNLDDESRINTPQFCLRTPSTGSRERSVDGQATAAPEDSYALLEGGGESMKEAAEHGAEPAGGDAIEAELTTQYGNQLTVEPAGVPLTELTVESEPTVMTEPTTMTEPGAAAPVGDGRENGSGSGAAEDKPKSSASQEKDTSDLQNEGGSPSEHHASKTELPEDEAVSAHEKASAARQENKNTSDLGLHNEGSSTSEHHASKTEQAEDETAINPHDKASAAGEPEKAGNTNESANGQPADVAVSADRDGQEDAVETCPEPTAAIQPGYGAQTASAPGEGEANHSHLEEFDASEENFVEELQQEYDKLS